MKTEFEKEDIQVIATEMADMLLQKLEDRQRTSLVDSEGLAEFLNVPRSWVYERTRDKSEGSIPRVKVGKYVRFNVHEVLEWLKKQ